MAPDDEESKAPIAVDAVQPRMIESTRNRALSSTTQSKRSSTAPILSWKQLLRLVHISEAKHGVSLYEYKWKWSVHGHVEGVGALVQTFMQFAREIDTGEVSCVNFDVPAAGHPQESSRNLSSGRLAQSRVNRSLRSQESIKMLCARNDQFLSVLFYDDVPHIPTSISQAFLDQILALFTTEFGSKFNPSHPKWKEDDEEFIQLKVQVKKNFDGPVVILQHDINQQFLATPNC